MSSLNPYSDTRTIEDTQWGKIEVCQPADPSQKLCDVFIVDSNQSKKFLSFYDGRFDDDPHKIASYIEMKMF